jgi:hypothetical protein
MAQTSNDKPSVTDKHLEKIREMITRAKNGDRTVLPMLRKFLDVNPKFWKKYGDMSLEVEHAWINRISGHDLVLRESLIRRVAQTRSELRGDASGPLENLLITQIIATQLQGEYADALSAQANNPALPRATFMLKRQESSARRHLASIRTLALIRRLLPRSLAHTGQSQTTASRWPGTAESCQSPGADRLKNYWRDGLNSNAALDNARRKHRATHGHVKPTRKTIQFPIGAKT